MNVPSALPDCPTPTSTPRLISCSWHGGDSRQHHLQQGGLAHARLFQPLRRGALHDPHDLHLTSALVAGPERPPLQPRATQPHAGHDAAGDGPGSHERGHGGPGDGPGHDAAGQPHGDVLQRPLTHGPAALVPAGARRRPSSTADFGWAVRRGRSDGGGGFGRRRSHDGSEHQPVSPLNLACHQPTTTTTLLTCSDLLTSLLPPSFTPPSSTPTQFVSKKEKEKCVHLYI